MLVSQVMMGWMDFPGYLENLVARVNQDGL